jgi:hypothetical protein
MTVLLKWRFETHKKRKILTDGMSDLLGNFE